MQSRTERLAPLTGVGFLVLYAVGFVMMTPDSPDFMDAPSKYVPYYVDHKSDVLLGGLLALLAAALLLWFVGSVRSALRVAEGGDGRVAGVGAAGGVVGIAMFVAGITALVLPALRLDNDQKLTVETAMTFQDLGSALLGLAAPVGFAVFLIAVAVVGIRHRAVPRAWAWITALIGVVMLIPMISWAGMIFAFPIWVLVMSVMLFRAKAPAGA